MPAKKVINGGTRTHNPQIRSLMRYPLRHADLDNSLVAIFSFKQILPHSRHYITYICFYEKGRYFTISENEAKWWILEISFVIPRESVFQWNEQDHAKIKEMKEDENNLILNENTLKNAIIIRIIRRFNQQNTSISDFIS